MLSELTDAWGQLDFCGPGADRSTDLQLRSENAVTESLLPSSDLVYIQCFTVLWQDGVPALQLLNASGDWIDAQPIPGTLIVK